MHGIHTCPFFNKARRVPHNIRVPQEALAPIAHHRASQQGVTLVGLHTSVDIIKLIIVGGDMLGSVYLQSVNLKKSFILF